MSDDNTIILMHFDGNLNEDASNYSISNIGIEKTFIQNPVVNLNDAIHFDNSEQSNGSFLTVPYSSELSMSGNWTIEFWFCINSWDQSFNSWPVPIVLPTTGWEANYFLEIPSSSAQLKYGFYNDDGQVTIFTSENSIKTEVWYHVALINDYDNSTIKLILHNSAFAKIEEVSATYSAGTTISTGTQDIKIGAGIAGDNYFNGYMDELRISNCVRDFSPVLPELPPLQAETDNIEFYSSQEDAGSWTELSPVIQNEYEELSSYWDRPGNTPLLPDDIKIKMYLLDRDDFLQYTNTQMPEWQCSWFNHETYTVIITPPAGDEQENYYGSFEALSKGSLAQLMVKLHLISTGDNSSPLHFLEGFGLYRGGYRPQKDKILQAVNDLGRLPEKSDLENTTDYATGYMKDLIVSYIECQLFNGIVYQNICTWMGTRLWHPYFQYYYQNSDNQRMMLRSQGDHFDIYCTAQDNQYLTDIQNKLEEKLAHYKNCFQLEIKNRFNVVILPNEAAGMSLMGYGDFYNGGSGCGGDKLDILSPVHFGGGLTEAKKSLIPHEFFHVFHNHMTPSMSLVYGFHAEGMAEVMAYEGGNLQYLQNMEGYFKNGIEKFQREKGRDPKLEDIMPDSEGYMSVYSYGQAFWYYMLQNHADYIQIKEFFASGNDWNVFDVSYEEIDAGYIDFLKTLTGLATETEEDNLIPENYSLEQNYPNPFNPVTTISYSLPEQTHVSIKVFDVLGREVTELTNGLNVPGEHKVVFDGTNLSSGVYYYSIKTSKYSKTKKLVLLK